MASSRPRNSDLTAPIAVAAALAVFGLTAHLSGPALAIPLASIASGVWVMARAQPVTSGTGEFGFDRVSATVLVTVVAGAGLGGGVGLWWRQQLGLTPWSAAHLEAFALVACAVGAVEEVVYRGWLFERLRPYGPAAAIGGAALAHAAYKSALFVWPSVGDQPDLLLLAGWTFAGGLVLGVLREVSRHAAPAVAAHAAFDLALYGTIASAPWWVWN